MSSDEGLKEVFEDSEDEPILKTRVFDFDEASDGDEQEAEAIGMYPLPLLSLLFLLFLLFLIFLLFLSVILYLLYIFFLPCSHRHA